MSDQRNDNESTGTGHDEGDSGFDEIIEPVVESLPGAGRLHDGPDGETGAERPGLEGDTESGENDPLLPDGPAPLP